MSGNEVSFGGMKPQTNQSFFAFAKERFRALLVLLCALLAPAAAHAVCVPTSASITYAADDYFFFYVNGNQVVNGTFFDAGAPPQTVATPVGDF